jgi:hypothetical protein
VANLLLKNLSAVHAHQSRHKTPNQGIKRGIWFLVLWLGGIISVGALAQIIKLFLTV